MIYCSGRYGAWPPISPTHSAGSCAPASAGWPDSPPCDTSTGHDRRQLVQAHAAAQRHAGLIADPASATSAGTRHVSPGRSTTSSPPPETWQVPSMRESTSKRSPSGRGATAATRSRCSRPKWRQAHTRSVSALASPCSALPGDGAAVPRASWESASSYSLAMHSGHRPWLNSTWEWALTYSSTCCQ